MQMNPMSDASETKKRAEPFAQDTPVQPAGNAHQAPPALYICDACNYIYDEASGDPDSGLPPGTRFEDIPDDWMCPVCGVTKRDFRMLKRDEQACANKTASENGTAAGLRLRASTQPGVVIIGAGHAGWAVARELRERAYEGSITLVSACDAIPYQKPQLSVAQSKGGLPPAWNTAQRDALASQLNVRVLPRTWVITTLHSQQRVMTTRGTLRYCDLVIATGAQARRASFAGTGKDRLLSLNELDDYRRIQEAINTFRSTAAHENRTMRIGIVGAGLVGCELANDFAASGHEVTLLDVQALPLQSRIGSEKAIALCKSLQGIGVRWIGNASIERVDAINPQDGNSHGVQVTLKDACKISKNEISTNEKSKQEKSDSETSDGQETEKTITQHPLQFDLAIACLGVVPRTRLAKSSNWACDEKGLKVDPQSLQLDCKVYALGDSVNIGGVTSGTLAPLMAQARCIAARICGQAENYESPPDRWILKTPCHPLSFGALVTHSDR